MITYSDIFKANIPLGVYDEKEVPAFENLQENLQENRKRTTKKKNKISDEMIVQFCSEPRALKEIVKYFGYSDIANFRKRYLNPLVMNGFIKMTIPGQPKNRNQRYYSDR